MAVGALAVWMSAVVLCLIPPLLVALLVVGLAVAVYQARETTPFSDQPMNHTGVTTRLRAHLDAYRAERLVKASPVAEPTAETPEADAMLASDDPERDTADADADTQAALMMRLGEATLADTLVIQNLTDELFETRMLLAQEREVTASYTDSFTPELLTGE
jgi:hypothetical protein